LQHGIGRPSTYAGIVRTIVGREYVAREKKSLLATELGFVVCDFLVAQFLDLFAVGFTVQMEEYLDRIARGERVWVEVLHEFYGPFAAAVTQAQGVAATEPVTVSGSKGQAVPTGETCPECGAEVVVREGKKKDHRMNSVSDTRNPFKRVTKTTRARRTRFNVFPVPGREFIRG
jgi:DNA topoisomerase-1